MSNAYKIEYTESGMIRGALIQYRNYFRAMALGGKWYVYKANPGETLSGVIIAPAGDCPGLLPLVEHVEAMTENTLRNALSLAIRKHGTVENVEVES